MPPLPFVIIQKNLLSSLFYSSATHSWTVCDESETALSQFEGKEGSMIPIVSDSDSEMDFMEPSEAEWDRIQPDTNSDEQYGNSTHCHASVSFCHSTTCTHVCI